MLRLEDRLSPCHRTTPWSRSSRRSGSSPSSRRGPRTPFAPGLRGRGGRHRDLPRRSVDALGEGADRHRRHRRSTAKKIREFFQTGRIAKLEELRKKYPPEFVELGKIPGLGPKTLLRLRSELGVHNLNDLRAAIEPEEASRHERPGREDGGEDPSRHRAHGSRPARTSGVPIAEALPIARELVAELEKLPEVERALYCGSLRRFRETIADVDIVVASREPSAVMEKFVKMPTVSEVIGSGETKTSVLTSTGLQVDLRIVEPRQFGAACQYFTGSQDPQHQAAADRPRTRVAPERVRAQRRRDRRGDRIRDRGSDLRGARPHVRFRPRCARTGARSRRRRRNLLPRCSRSRTSAATCTCIRLSPGTAGARSTRWSPRRPRGATLPGAHRSRREPRVQRRQPREVSRTARGDRCAPRRHPKMALLHGVELNIGARRRARLRPRPFAAVSTGASPASTRISTSARAEQTRRVMAAMEDPTVNAIAHLTGPEDRPPSGNRARHRRGAAEGGRDRHAPSRSTRRSGGSTRRARCSSARETRRHLRHSHRRPPHPRARAHGVGGAPRDPRLGRSLPHREHLAEREVPRVGGEAAARLAILDFDPVPGAELRESFAPAPLRAALGASPREGPIRRLSASEAPARAARSPARSAPPARGEGTCPLADGKSE